MKEYIYIYRYRYISIRYVSLLRVYLYSEAVARPEAVCLGWCLWLSGELGALHIYIYVCEPICIYVFIYVYEHYIRMCLRIFILMLRHIGL